jgi:methyltransferase (TIGR00027 family)
LISDPWAEALAGPEGEALAQRVDQIMAHRELWVATRTAVIDQQVLARTRAPEPVRQVVLLGAGLDTRAARLATPGVRFFEVDHPASQADKLERLRRMPGYPVAAAAYVACDFERDDFIGRLLEAGFRDEAPALVIWEGVTPYLLEPAVRGTLRSIATRCDQRTVLIFDHFMKRLVEAPSPTPKDQETRALVEALGERFVFGTNDPLPMLYEEGFRHVRSVSFDEACLSLTGTYAREREFRFQRIVLASRERAGSL